MLKKGFRKIILSNMQLRFTNILYETYFIYFMDIVSSNIAIFNILLAVWYSLHKHLFREHYYCLRGYKSKI